MKDDRTKDLRLEGEDFKGTVSRRTFEDVVNEFAWCADKVSHLMKMVTADNLHIVADTVIDILLAHRRRVNALHETLPHLVKGEKKGK